MSLGIWQLLLLLVIVLLLFGGGGKLSRLMGDLGKGVRSLREGLKGEDEEKKEPPRQISQNAEVTQEKQSEKDGISGN